MKEIVMKVIWTSWHHSLRYFPCPRLEEGTFKGSEAKACRKIVQTVETKKSIIRECAYSGDVVDGQKKTGNWGINMYYYQCENTVRIAYNLGNTT
ncbi:hypothetical protein ANCCEY_00067 [Ancylostoma ceylanicum]|uniref:Uncharacterized protein n=1 Tax=Ancylostoma ceylanicum TaxID=53326 RepID=A0A0D6M9T9_9BILA|nr:hypothetical protein ANCCEY_00067 [Ancylostoma ceylanicum]